MEKGILKKSVFAILFVLMLAATVMSASAAWSIPDTLTLGSTSQDRELTTQSTLTITNLDNTTDISSISVQFTRTITGFTNTDFNITFSGVPTTINQNSSSTLTVQGFVPISFDSGSRKIGDITLTGVSDGVTLTKTVALSMSAESDLEITDVDVDVDGDSESVSDGETIDAKRGDPVSLTITVRNQFSTSTDIDINDVTVNIESDSDLDVDDQEDLVDLSPRDEDEVTFSFEIPDDTDDGTHRMTITLEGTDDNGATHTDAFEFRFDVEVPTREVTINDVTFSPASVCRGETLRTEVEIKNTGRRDLEDAMVFLTVDDLDISEKIRTIVIDEGDRTTKSINIPIPKTAALGTYFMDVEAYWEESNSALTDQTSQVFTVKDCQAVTPPPAQNQTGTSGGFVVNPPTTTGGQVFGTTPIKRTSSFFESNGYLVLLIITNLLILILIIVILTQARSKY